MDSDESDSLLAEIDAQSDRLAGGDTLVNGLDALQSSDYEYQLGRSELLEESVNFAAVVLLPLVLICFCRLFPRMLFDQYYRQTTKSGARSKSSAAERAAERAAYFLYVRQSEDFCLLVYYVFSVSMTLVCFGTSGALRHWFESGALHHSLASVPAMGDGVAWWIRTVVKYQLAFYASLLVIGFFPPRKGDYRVLTAHHVAAFSLTFAGYAFGHERTCVMVLFVHDVCDVFLQLSSIANRFESRMRAPFFALFTASHLLFRVLAFPAIAYGTLFSSSNRPASLQEVHAGWAITMSLVSFIWAMHIYWLGLCLQKVAVFLRHGEKAAAQDERDQHGIEMLRSPARRHKSKASSDAASNSEHKKAQ